jgi:sugar O-acyltransferase (sialic acid O-acetyltransferase NeuD family)
MKRLLIVGAGNVGGYLSYNISDFGDYDVLGFLDDDKKKIGTVVYGRKVLGDVDSISNYIKNEKLSVVIGISSPQVKFKIVKRLEEYGVYFPNFIAKNVWVSNNVNLGKGIILYPGVSINYESVIGDFVIMNMNCAVGHNCTVESYTTLAPGVNLGGYTHIEESASIGIGVSTIQKVRVGKSSIVGGQSMLVKNVTPGSTVVGVPAKVIK